MKLLSVFLFIGRETALAQPCVEFIESPGSDARTWDEAWEACERKGGELAFFRTQEELQIFLNDHSSHHHRWLGIYREGREWRNIRGEFQNILDWNIGEPNNSGGRENCVNIYKNGIEPWHNTFNDLECSHKLPYTCRIENCSPEEENFMFMDTGIADVFEYEEEEEEEQEKLMVFNEEIVDIFDSLVNNFSSIALFLSKNK